MRELGFGSQVDPQVDPQVDVWDFGSGDVSVRLLLFHSGPIIKDNSWDTFKRLVCLHVYVVRICVKQPDFTAFTCFSTWVFKYRAASGPFRTHKGAERGSETGRPGGAAADWLRSNAGSGSSDEFMSLSDQLVSSLQTLIAFT